MEKLFPKQKPRHHWWLWLGLAVVLGLGTWGVWGRRPPPPPPKPAPPNAPTAQMKTLSLTEIQEGDKRWILEAGKADFHKERDEIGLSDVRVEFFGPNEHIKVRADEGLFNTKTRMLTLKGRVEMLRGEMIITTSVATYLPGERLLLAPEEVVLADPRLRIQGKGLKVELGVKKLVLAQHRLTEVKVAKEELKR